MASKPIYQIYAELEGYKPAIWRRLWVMETVPMSKFGYMLLTMFEMQASHLFCFNIPVLENLKIRYAEIAKNNNEFILGLFERLTDSKDLQIEILSEFSNDFMGTIKLIDVRDIKLANALAKKDETAVLNYDYGDDWKINIRVEEIFTDKELDGKELPRVIAGEGFGIIEDCGGVFGLKKIAKAYKKRSGSEYKEYVEWLGITDLDLTSFDIDDMNFRIKKIPKIYADAYEKRLVPTQKSIDFIERKYFKSDE